MTSDAEPGIRHRNESYAAALIMGGTGELGAAIGQALQFLSGRFFSSKIVEEQRSSQRHGDDDENFRQGEIYTAFLHRYQSSLGNEKGRKSFSVKNLRPMPTTGLEPVRLLDTSS